MKKLLFISVLSALFTFSATTQANTFYRWVDSDGSTHFTKQPPSKGKSTAVQTFSDAATENDETKSGDEDLVNDTENHTAQEDSPSAAELNEQLKKWCAGLKQNLYQLENDKNLYMTDLTTGEPAVLDDDKRLEMIIDTKRKLSGC